MKRNEAILVKCNCCGEIFNHVYVGRTLVVCPFCEDSFVLYSKPKLFLVIAITFTIFFMMSAFVSILCLIIYLYSMMSLSLHYTRSYINARRDAGKPCQIVFVNWKKK